MARSYFCDHCKHAMAKGGRVTLNIAVNELTRRLFHSVSPKNSLRGLREIFARIPRS